MNSNLKALLEWIDKRPANERPDLLEVLMKHIAPSLQGNASASAVSSENIEKVRYSLSPEIEVKNIKAKPTSGITLSSVDASLEKKESAQENNDLARTQSKVKKQDSKKTSFDDIEDASRSPGPVSSQNALKRLKERDELIEDTDFQKYIARPSVQKTDWIQPEMRLPKDIFTTDSTFSVDESRMHLKQRELDLDAAKEFFPYSQALFRGWAIPKETLEIIISAWPKGMQDERLRLLDRMSVLTLLKPFGIHDRAEVMRIVSIVERAVQAKGKNAGLPLTSDLSSYNFRPRGGYGSSAAHFAEGGLGFLITPRIAATIPDDNAGHFKTFEEMLLGLENSAKVAAGDQKKQARSLTCPGLLKRGINFEEGLPDPRTSIGIPRVTAQFARDFLDGYFADPRLKSSGVLPATYFSEAPFCFYNSQGGGYTSKFKEFARLLTTGAILRHGNFRHQRGVKFALARLLYYPLHRIENALFEIGFSSQENRVVDMPPEKRAQALLILKADLGVKSEEDLLPKIKTIKKDGSPMKKRGRKPKG
jgi:hypothetical protein